MGLRLGKEEAAYEGRQKEKSFSETE